MIDRAFSANDVSFAGVFNKAKSFMRASDAFAVAYIYYAGPFTTRADNNTCAASGCFV